MKDKHKKRKRQASSQRSESINKSFSSNSSYYSSDRSSSQQRSKRRRQKQRKIKKQKYRQQHSSHKNKQSIQNRKHHNRQKQTSKYQSAKSSLKYQQKQSSYYNVHNIKIQDVQAAKKQQQQKKYDAKRSPSSQNISKQDIKPQKPQKQKPCFQPSGILLQYYNSRQGVSLKFHQPPQARQPPDQWRIYIFKGEEVLKPIVLEKSCYLIGKDERIVDILTENPSISRQHCVIQFRLVQKRQTQGQFQQTIKPYIMDLESTNGTLLNDQKIQPGRYYQLLHKDVLKFGFSDRQYVIVKWQKNTQENN